ncbi:nucleotide sugar dehydrogenase [Clostridium ganghwense]|uniref:Nucleotide sugar dehydrogenase n=1 Tax=Clostridium ganghwense TaxID=312089 RepID=A0ABT4CRA8_9CLOT|nr:nucleotide sugar dehydrogenase [Clostridium ganghwense]MCY6370529.1 nucleotide sugar dehydrogenase [Clostridium ganghwense]
MEVYVFGLGHIGLPMATWIALSKYHVNGIDINPTTIDNIVNGNVNIEEYYKEMHISKLAKKLISENKFKVSTDLKRIDKKPAVFVIAVGIADKENGEQDISPLLSVLDTLMPQLVDGDLILFRTTLIPGTCENIIYPKLNSLDVSVNLAYCPETLMETHAFKELENNSMILAANNDEGFLKAKSFLRSLSKAPIYKASNIRTAEMTKVVQNIYRDVNIALSNEISEATSQLNIDIYELQALANTHPRVEFLTPGPGVGGYCLPNAYHYLRKAIIQKEDCPLSLISLARKLNVERPKKIVDLIKKALNDANKDITNSTIGILGLAMKDFCADCRFSPAVDIAYILKDIGSKVKAYDPKVPLKYDFQVSSLEECIKNIDCLVITVNQEGINFNYDKLNNSMSKPIIVVDTKNIFPNYANVKLYTI